MCMQESFWTVKDTILVISDLFHSVPGRWDEDKIICQLSGSLLDQLPSSPPPKCTLYEGTQ